jgi:hypothetical protein
LVKYHNWGFDLFLKTAVMNIKNHPDTWWGFGVVLVYFGIPEYVTQWMKL